MVDNSVDIQDRSAVSWGWRDIALIVCIIVVCSAVLIFAINILIASTNIVPSGGFTSPIIFTLGTGLYVFVVLAIYLVVGWRVGWAALGMRHTSAGNYMIVGPLFIVGFMMLIGVNLLVSRLFGAFENPQVDALSDGRALATHELAMLMLLIAGIAPFVEELFFRGLLYPVLRRSLGPFAAVIANAALFAVIHFIVPLLPGLFILGLILAYLRERSGSIWPSVMYHMIQNSIALLAFNAVLQSSNS